MMRTKAPHFLTVCAMLVTTGHAGESTGVAPPPEEALAIVVHKSNPVNDLAWDELHKLCLADRRHWSDGRKVTLALRETEQPEGEAVLRQVYQMTQDEFRRHFLQSAFTGAVQSAPKHLATAAGVRRFIFNVPGAIGFVRASEVDDSVKVVRLDGKAPGDPGYKLTVPRPGDPASR